MHQFTNFKTEDFLNSFDDHDSKKLSRTVSNELGDSGPPVQQTASSDFSALRRSGTANFALLLNRSLSLDLPAPSFNDPPETQEGALGKRAAPEPPSPPKSAKKSKGKSRGTSAKSSKAKSKKSKSPLRERESGSKAREATRELRKQFSFGDLSLAFSSGGEHPLSRAPSSAGLGVAVKLENSNDFEPEKMNLRSQSSPKPSQ